MANRINDWEATLADKNQLAKLVGAQIKVKEEEGNFNVLIYWDSFWDNAGFETYAENCFEDEVEDCINGAWALIRNKSNKTRLYLLHADLIPEDKDFYELTDDEVIELCKKDEDGFLHDIFEDFYEIAERWAGETIFDPDFSYMRVIRTNPFK